MINCVGRVPGGMWGAFGQLFETYFMRGFLASILQGPGPLKAHAPALQQRPLGRRGGAGGVPGAARRLGRGRVRCYTSRPPCGQNTVANSQ